MTESTPLRWLSAGAALSCVLSATDAHAAGLYVTDRGVRPMGRGGAFIAGADDLGAIYYNPAGIRDAGNAVLVDATYVNYSADYTRRTQVIDGSGVARVYQYPKVSSTTPFLPIPTIAASHHFGSRFTGAIAVMGPNAALQNFPTESGGQPAASRYSLVSLNGSILAVLSAGGALKITDKFTVGANLQALVGSFTSRVYFNANPADRFLGAPEDPNYDTDAQLSAKPIIAPSGNLGLKYQFTDWLRVGLSGQLPYWINAPATVKTKLPDVALFDNAKQVGDSGRVKFVLPAIVRLGVEYKKVWEERRSLAVEIAYVREFWSMHKNIDVATSDVTLTGITGFPSPFYVPPIKIPRNLKDSNSFRIGGEYTFPVSEKIAIAARAGFSFETSSADPAWVSPLTIDGNKVIPSLGAGVHIGKGLRIDASFTKVFLFGVDVDPAVAKVPRINPVVGNPVATEPVNGGSYRASANLFGLGVNYKY
jgi:long-chain fatty acid transport protein